MTKLLKIGNRWINPDKIVSITDFTDDCGEIALWIDLGDARGVDHIYVYDDEREALLRWLDANSVDLSAGQPENGEQVIPQPRFGYGDEVEVIANGHRKGQIGEVTQVNWDGKRYLYTIHFGTADSDLLGEGSLDIAPTSTRKLGRK